jgi:multisubunit Na+/H+ antiporter MnhB subunit
MLTLGLTGLLNIVLAVTLLLLITVILEKERPEDADNLDRVLLLIFGVCFAASLAFSGFLVMAGAAKDIPINELAVEALITIALKVVAITAGWIKIVRTSINNNRRD